MIERLFSRDVLPVFSAAGNRQQFWHTQGRPIFDILSIHHFLWRSRRRQPSKVGRRMALDRLSWHVTCRDHASFCLSTVARRLTDWVGGRSYVMPFSACQNIDGVTDESPLPLRRPCTVKKPTTGLSGACGVDGGGGALKTATRPWLTVTQRCSLGSVVLTCFQG